MAHSDNTTINICLPRSLKERLRGLSYQTDKSKSKIVCAALESYLPKAESERKQRRGENNVNI